MSASSKKEIVADLAQYLREARDVAAQPPAPFHHSRVVSISVEDRCDAGGISVFDTYTFNDEELGATIEALEAFHG